MYTPNKGKSKLPQTPKLQPLLSLVMCEFLKLYANRAGIIKGFPVDGKYQEIVMKRCYGLVGI